MRKNSTFITSSLFYNCWIRNPYCSSDCQKSFALSSMKKLTKLWECKKCSQPNLASILTIASIFKFKPRILSTALSMTLFLVFNIGQRSWIMNKLTTTYRLYNRQCWWRNATASVCRNFWGKVGLRLSWKMQRLIGNSKNFWLDKLIHFMKKRKNDTWLIIILFIFQLRIPTL